MSIALEGSPEITDSKSIAVVVRNLIANPVTLKKNAPVTRMVAANAVPYIQIQPGRVEKLDAAQGIQKPKITVKQQREVLFEWLDLSGLES